jgi:hypothetical protein
MLDDVRALGVNFVSVTEPFDMMDATSGFARRRQA